jgi:hypothetical protein
LEKDSKYRLFILKNHSTFDVRMITHGARYYSDVQLFWHDKNPMYTGLDFGLKFGRFEVHLGGLIGAIVDVAYSNDSEEEGPVLNDSNSVSLSASYEFKTR